MYKTYYSSPLGQILLISDDDNLLALKLECHRFYDKFEASDLVQKDDLGVFKNTKLWLDNYFAGKAPDIEELPLSPAGSKFRQDVWNILCKIPYGEVITYGEIAKKLSHNTDIKMSAQAVGGAVGHNPISIIIPCHRVVGANNNLTGYGGGIKNKIKLLKLEKVDVDQFHIPTSGTAL